jgi:hypothetical protein
VTRFTKLSRFTVWCYPRQSVAEAADFVRSCRIGQTERGSYVAAILAPVPPNLTPSLLDALDGEDGVAEDQRTVRNSS